MNREKQHGNTRHDWLLAIFSGLLGAGISSAIMWYTFYDNLESVKNIEQTRLITELRKEFYDSDSIYADIRNAMNELDKNGECLALYDQSENKSSLRGAFNFTQLTEYLGFFENLGYLANKKTLDIDLINEFFGGAIAEAYHRKELQIYIEKMQEDNKGAYKQFQNLANQDILKNNPDFNNFKDRVCWKNFP